MSTNPGKSPGFVSIEHNRFGRPPLCMGIHGAEMFSRLEVCLFGNILFYYQNRSTGRLSQIAIFAEFIVQRYSSVYFTRASPSGTVLTYTKFSFYSFSPLPVLTKHPIAAPFDSILGDRCFYNNPMQCGFLHCLTTQFLGTRELLTSMYVCINMNNTKRVRKQKRNKKWS